MKPTHYDERIQQANGLSAILALSLTQLALGIIVLVRAYVLNQPDDQFRDIQLVLAGSLVGYFALRAVLGGNMPVPKLWHAASAYAVMVIALTTILTLWLGPPDLSDWTNNILPVLVGPALVVATYWFFAALGRRRLERTLED